MKNLFITLTSVFLMLQSCKSASEAAKNPAPALTVVSFNSICCGVRADTFLKAFFEAFKNKNDVQLSASKVTGCGKEGEYKVMFDTKQLSGSMYKKFSGELKNLIDTESDKHKSSQDGTLNIETMDSIDISYCRGKQVVF